ncbi:MAG: aspartate--tRNA ligase [Defluviitaleaceae bacterium]|nr:aspartate--tRNA ligase [Defluviitaleaceae bacterium]MCL2835693.1 aspartate--tRNA ligase [Defluviitaleaceae bacterium]
MGETITGLKRTHMCAELNENMNGQTVTVMGWAHNTRKLGQLIFIALRDRTGLLQLAFDENETTADIFAKAKAVKGEYVIAVTGKVRLRAEKDINRQMETGKIEIAAEELRILNEADTPPFQVAAEGVGNEMRLKYRYIDMRRPEMQRKFLIRHKTCQAMREFYSNEGFIEVETPYLNKGTPEGAKEYVVPSRIFPGNFYVLPQSPQQFKQLLMVGGFDKYFQIVRCFRDEDNRADRQPEFTQLDVELSFVDTDDVLDVTERMLKHVFKKAAGIDVELPIQRMPYAEAMERFGSDKPDLRFGMEIVNISHLTTGTEFEVFKSAEAEKHSVRGINAAGCANMPRKQQDALQEYVKTFKAKGLMFIAIDENGEVKTSLSKFLSPEQLRAVTAAFNAEPGDLICMCAGRDGIVLDALGNLRCEVARRMDIIPRDVNRFVWVTEMPLLELDEESGKWNAVHHPFTSPLECDLHMFETNPGKIRAKAYDIVLNGLELGGGSVRIHQPEVQKKMFRTLGLSDDEITARFGHMLEAFRFGAPPHGGIAFGLDRVVMLMCGEENIREVIAFPKTKEQYCLLTDAPNTVSEKQLNELSIKIKS